LTGLQAEQVKLSEDAGLAVESLEQSSDRSSTSIVRRVHALKPILLADCQYGEVVKKSRIPKALKAKYRLENLYVVDLPSFWRLLYTITRDGATRYIVVVEIVDHESYNRWFPGRGR
jgi:hypothetical protein